MGIEPKALNLKCSDWGSCWQHRLTGFPDVNCLLRFCGIFPSWSSFWGGWMTCNKRLLDLPASDHLCFGAGNDWNFWLCSYHWDLTVLLSSSQASPNMLLSCSEHKDSSEKKHKDKEKTKHKDGSSEKHKDKHKDKDKEKRKEEKVGVSCRGDKRMSLFHTANGKEEEKVSGCMLLTLPSFVDLERCIPALRTGDVLCGVPDERLQGLYLQVLWAKTVSQCSRVHFFHIFPC